MNPTTAIADEVHTSAGVLGELIPFAYMPDTSKTLTVKTAGDVACVAGTDYLATPHGIQVLSSSKVDATGVKVSYTPRASKSVQMLNGSQQEFELFIAGAVCMARTPREVRHTAGVLGAWSGVHQAYRFLRGSG
ncbi:hypothetical protein PSGK_15370 [Pseudomonas solani]|uniref:hypothetical protein n=1 Tax=Pseudomonas solani TaxID=2731552 RepID=UPI0035BE28C0